MMRWDIFCRVIDNYGDIGVCWRLARQLVAEHGIAVRLWVDNVASLQRICPDADATQEVQNCRGVEVWRWVEPFPDLAPAEVVIEAFGCELPENYVAAMVPTVLHSTNQAQSRLSPAKRGEIKRVWINLEYLSAEQWVEGCHGLPSPHPRLPMIKHFFFPGFTPVTGGLLREKGLLVQRNALQHNLAALWCQLDLPLPISPETTISLFCYDSAPIGNLLDAWAASTTAIRCLLPEGKALEQAANWAGRTSLAAGDSVQRGNLVLHVIPFLSQENYDLLLWACDCNFVRGEDSFVRAQWAARPLIWQIYPQQDNVHQVKLNAFFDRYCQGLAEEAAAVLRTFHHNWNSGGRLDWNDFWQHRAVLQAHAVAWAGQLAHLTDLASNLVSFCKNKMSSKNSSF